MNRNIQDTSIAAYRAMPVKQLATQADRIERIVQKWCSPSDPTWKTHYGLSLKEIKSIYQQWHGDIELSTVSDRVNALVAAKRLERLETTRKCSISGINIHPVRVSNGQST
jgi:hypothetical protein